MKSIIRLALVAAVAGAALAPAAGTAAAASPKTAIPGHPVVVWTNPSASGDGVSRVILEAVAGTGQVSALTSGDTTASCIMYAVNPLGWHIWEYTIYQRFLYNGTNITYVYTPTKTSNAYWGWYDAGSGNPAFYWISNPRSGYALGSYYFRHDVGDLHESNSGWVQADVRGTGSWSCSGA